MRSTPYDETLSKNYLDQEFVALYINELSLDKTTLGKKIFQNAIARIATFYRLRDIKRLTRKKLRLKKK